LREALLRRTTRGRTPRPNGTSFADAHGGLAELEGKSTTDTHTANSATDALAGVPPASAPPPPPPRPAPAPSDFSRLCGPPGGPAPFDEPPLARKAREIAAAYADIFAHIRVKRGWASLPFEPSDVAEPFRVASEVAALLRHFRDRCKAGIVLRKIDGMAQAVLWDTAAPPPGARAAWADALSARLAHATLCDAWGYVEGFTRGEVEAALAARRAAAAAAAALLDGSAAATAAAAAIGGGGACSSIDRDAASES